MLILLSPANTLEFETKPKTDKASKPIFSGKANKLVRKMQEKNIMVSRVHERNDKHTCVKEFKSFLPTLDKVVNEMICIPNGWWLTDEEREYIVNTIKPGW